MKAGYYILHVLLPLYQYILAADAVTPYQIDAMNHMFTLPGWRNLMQSNGFKIVVQWMEEGTESILSATDILKPVDEGGQIVTGESAGCKIRQAHQLLSCQYSSILKLCYQHNISAVLECKNIDVPSKSSECVSNILEMIKKIDKMVVRILGTLTCIYEVFPITTYDEDVSETMKDFKRFYDNLYFDNTSLDKKYHDAIIESIEKNMNTAFQSLSKFYHNFCRPNEDDSISRITKTVQELDESYPPLYVLQLIKYRIDLIVNGHVKDYDKISVGFKYDTVLKRTFITYDP